MKQQGIPQILVDMDEGIKEIRKLLLENVDRKAYENALLKNARMEKTLDDVHQILRNHHLPTAVRVYEAIQVLENAIDDEIPF